MLLVFEVFALAALRYVVILFAGFDMFDFKTSNGKWIGGSVAGLTLLWLLRVLSTGGTHSLGAKVLHGSSQHSLKRLHDRVTTR